MKIKTLIILLLLFILSLSANAGSTGVKPNPAYVNQELEFYISLDDSLNSDYGILLQLGNGEGGWLSDKIMSSKNNNRYFYYKRSISQAGVNRKWRYTLYNISTTNKVEPWYEKTYTVSEAPTPQVNSFTANPSSPKKFESIEFTATTNVATSNVKFKCGGGSWQTSYSSDNLKWKYTRDVGLKADTTCYVDINGDEVADDTLTLNVSDPKFTISKNNDSPKVNDNITFTVATDKIESGYKVQVKFSTNGIWSDMSPSSNRDSWEFDRVFETTGSKTVSFRIVNSSLTSFHDTSISFSVNDVVVSVSVDSFTANPSSPKKFESIEFTATTNITVKYLTKINVIL
jgi:hypothetical protein